MEQARSARVWAAISACAWQEGAAVSLRHVVIACADALAAAGAGLTLTRDSVLREPVLASAPAVEELEELQFTLGQGPCMEAAAALGPVLVADLSTPDARHRWPVFAPAAADRGVRGMFAFPVSAGAALVGVLDVYRLRAGPLVPEELAQALVFGDAVLVLALDQRNGITSDPDSLPDAMLSARRVQVHQATGMVAVQLGVSMADALAALRAQAYAHGRRLSDLAAEVVARRVCLAPGSPNGSAASGPPAGEVRDHGNDSPEPGIQPGPREEEE